MSEGFHTHNSSSKELTLSELGKGTFGITPDFGRVLAQAASVCLEEQNHRNGAQLNVDGDFSRRFMVWWDTTTEQMRRCWGDYEVTTEHGAYGIAALLVPRLTGLTITERSRKNTGFDFWLGSEREGDLLFQNKARLEVSGIRNGDDSAISSRVRQKIKQTMRSAGLFQAYVIVVEFGGPRSRVVKR